MQHTEDPATREATALSLIRTSLESIHYRVKGHTEDLHDLAEKATNPLVRVEAMIILATLRGVVAILSGIEALSIEVSIDDEETIANE